MSFFNKTVPPATYTLTYSPLYAQLLTYPHLLVAGTTGSGKSVCLRGIVQTAFLNPCYFVFIDLKKTEFCEYSQIRTCIAYADEPEQAQAALDMVLNLINERNKESAAARVRFSSASPVYVVVDEMSDLLFCCKRAKSQLARIAMVGRSANVHLLLATQCPNRKVLSAEILSNIPVKIALRCESPIESRQVIGTADAVNLPMYGYALVKAPAYASVEKVAVPLFSDADLNVPIQALSVSSKWGR